MKTSRLLVADCAKDVALIQEIMRVVLNLTSGQLDGKNPVPPRMQFKTMALHSMAPAIRVRAWNMYNLTLAFLTMDRGILEVQTPTQNHLRLQALLCKGREDLLRRTWTRITWTSGVVLS